MKRYSSYKDSGVEWIGEIPEYWRISKLSYYCEVKDGTHSTPKYIDNGGVPLVTQKDIKDGRLSFSNTKNISIEDYNEINKRSNVKENDLIMPMIGSIGTPALVNTDRTFSIKNVALFKTSEASQHTNYVYFLLSSSITDHNLNYNSRGGVQGFVSLDVLRSLLYIIPPLHEQKAIAHYLDQKTALIDDLIDRTTRKIALLREQRTAIINQAVTKGLDPAVPMKDSGIEWIGEIPQEWKLSKLKYSTLNIFLGLTGKVDYVDEPKDGVAFLRATNIAKGVLELNNLRYISHRQHKKLTVNNKVKKGDVLITKSGSIGVCALVHVDIECSLYESLFAIRPNSRVSNKFLFHVLNSYCLNFQYKKNIVGMGVPHLNISDVKETIITIPPTSEQKEISVYLDQKTNEIDRLMSKEQRAIVLLKEYRQALISEVVTGKICVLNYNPSHD